MLPKKNSRPITVAGKKYRWQCKYGGSRLIGSSGATMRLTVQADATEPGNVLQCKLFSKHPSAAAQGNGDEWMYPEHKVSLTPRDVASLITFALTNGWEPSEKGSVFTLNSGPEMTDYRVVGP